MREVGSMSNDHGIRTMPSKNNAAKKPSAIPMVGPLVICSPKIKKPMVTVESMVKRSMIALPTERPVRRTTSIQLTAVRTLRPIVTNAHFGPG